jgi:metal-responsive CopG/Arc/MetJ family transcriptional regulator
MNATKKLGRLTITISRDLVQRLTAIKERHAVSVSAVAEIAIRAYIDSHADHDLGELLRAAGGKIRR